MSTKQKIVLGRGPFNINLVTIPQFALLKFAGLHNHSLLLTMIKTTKQLKIKMLFVLGRLEFTSNLFLALNYFCISAEI